MRTVQVQEITEQIREMCILVNHELSQDMQEKLAEAKSCEESVLGKQILEQLEDNLKIAKEDRIPICQDTGMAVIFLEIGQDVHLEGGNVEEAINEGVRQGYVQGYLRKSVVKDPLIRENTKDYSCSKRIWKRKHEPCLYAETGRWNRRSEKGNLTSGRRCRTECLSADGSRSRDRWYF